MCFRIPAFDCSERKYFSSTMGSRTSDNEDPFTVLRDAVIAAVKHTPLRIVPQLIQRPEDRPKGPPLIVAKESLDVFKEQVPWRFGRGNPSDFKKESPSSVGKSSAPASHAESLARESPAQDFEIWQPGRINCPDVSMMGF
jgi:hypothetical protein